MAGVAAAAAASATLQLPADSPICPVPSSAAPVMSAGLTSIAENSVKLVHDVSCRSGGQGCVHKAVWHINGTNLDVAVKFWRDEPTHVRVEASVLGAHTHANVVRMHGFTRMHSPHGRPTEGPVLVMVMDWMQASVANWMESEAQPPVLVQRVHVLAMACCGLSFLHERGTAHNDIKPENIMMQQSSSQFGFSVVKVTDAGSASAVTGGSPAAITHRYCIPSHADIGNEQRDVQAFGLTAAELLAWDRAIVERLRAGVAFSSADIVLGAGNACDAGMLDTLTAIVNDAVSARASVSDIAQRLSHVCELMKRAVEAQPPTDVAGLAFASCRAVLSRRDDDALAQALHRRIVHGGRDVSWEDVLVTNERPCRLHLQGPPGRGKSTVLAALVRAFYHQSPAMRPNWTASFDTLVFMSLKDFTASMMRIRDEDGASMDTLLRRYIAHGAPDSVWMALRPPSAHSCRRILWMIDDADDSNCGGTGGVSAQDQRSRLFQIMFDAGWSAVVASRAADLHGCVTVTLCQLSERDVLAAIAYPPGGCVPWSAAMRQQIAARGVMEVLQEPFALGAVKRAGLLQLLDLDTYDMWLRVERAAYRLITSPDAPDQRVDAELSTAREAWEACAAATLLSRPGDSTVTLADPSTASLGRGTSCGYCTQCLRCGPHYAAAFPSLLPLHAARSMMQRISVEGGTMEVMQAWTRLMLAAANGGRARACARLCWGFLEAARDRVWFLPHELHRVCTDFHTGRLFSGLPLWSESDDSTGGVQTVADVVPVTLQSSTNDTILAEALWAPVGLVRWVCAPSGRGKTTLSRFVAAAHANAAVQVVSDVCSVDLAGTNVGGLPAWSLRQHYVNVLHLHARDLAPLDLGQSHLQMIDAFWNNCMQLAVQQYNLRCPLPLDTMPDVLALATSYVKHVSGAVLLVVDGVNEIDPDGLVLSALASSASMPAPSYAVQSEVSAGAAAQPAGEVGSPGGISALMTVSNMRGVALQQQPVFTLPPLAWEHVRNRLLSLNALGACEIVAAAESSLALREMFQVPLHFSMLCAVLSSSPREPLRLRPTASALFAAFMSMHAISAQRRLQRLNGVSERTAVGFWQDLERQLREVAWLSRTNPHRGPQLLDDSLHHGPLLRHCRFLCTRHDRGLEWCHQSVQQFFIADYIVDAFPDRFDLRGAENLARTHFPQAQLRQVEGRELSGVVADWRNDMLRRFLFTRARDAAAVDWLLSLMGLAPGVQPSHEQTLTLQLCLQDCELAPASHLGRAFTEQAHGFWRAVGAGHENNLFENATFWRLAHTIVRTGDAPIPAASGILEAALARERVPVTAVVSALKVYACVADRLQFAQWNQIDRLVAHDDARVAAVAASLRTMKGGFCRAAATQLIQLMQRDDNPFLREEAVRVLAVHADKLRDLGDSVVLPLGGTLSGIMEKGCDCTTIIRCCMMLAVMNQPAWSPFTNVSRHVDQVMFTNGLSARLAIMAVTPGLDHVRLHGLLEAATDLQRVADGMPYLPLLREMTVTDTCLDGAALDALRSAVDASRSRSAPLHPGLEALVLEGCRLESDGAGALWDVLRQLRSVSLQGCTLAPAHVQALAGVFADPECAITHLDIRGTGLPEDQVNALCGGAAGVRVVLVDAATPAAANRFSVVGTTLSTLPRMLCPTRPARAHAHAGDDQGDAGEEYVRRVSYGIMLLTVAALLEAWVGGSQLRDWQAP